MTWKDLLGQVKGKRKAQFHLLKKIQNAPVSGRKKPREETTTKDLREERNAGDRVNLLSEGGGRRSAKKKNLHLKSSKCKIFTAPKPGQRERKGDK